MKKAAILLIFVFGLNSIYADGIDQFELTFDNDIIIGSTAALSFAAGTILKNIIEPTYNDYDWIDEDFIFEYSESLDSISDILTLTPMLALPLLLDDWDKDSILTLGILYTETALYSLGFKDIIKSLVQRSRPYYEFDSTPSELLEDDDSYLSFPSGHTTFAFMTATFSTYIYSQGSSSKTKKIVVGASSFALATTVGALRIASGNHHLFDVLAGAGLGTTIGFLVPYLHKVLPEDFTPTVSNNCFGLSLKL